MEVIVFESESFKKLINELTSLVIRQVERRYSEKEWLSENEAKQILGIKSKVKLQQLRDNLDIEFSKFGKIIRYSRSSILSFLEQHRRSLDKL